MGSFSIWHWMVVLLVVLLLFGGNKVSGLMGDFAKGIKSFKKNMAEPDDASMEDTAARPADRFPARRVKPRRVRRGRRRPRTEPRAGMTATGHRWRVAAGRCAARGRAPGRRWPRSRRGLR